MYMLYYMSSIVRKPAFCIYAKTKTQINFAVSAKLISAFFFATLIVQSLYFLNPRFQASSHLLCLHSPVCVGPGQKSQGPVFSRHGSYLYYVAKTNVLISLAITAQLICVFVFEYGKSRFLHDTVHMEPGVVDLSAMKPTRPHN